MPGHPRAWMGWLLAAAALAFGCSAAAAPERPGADLGAGSVQMRNGDPPMNVDADLAEQMATSRGSAREFPVIVTLQHADDMSAVLATGLRPTMTYRSIPGFAASLSADQIAAIAKLPQVELIELDRAAWALSPR